MVRSAFGAFTSGLAMTDLRWMPGEPFSPGRLRIELLSGLTVALALVPEAVAFAFVAGVHPLVGLYAAFLVGLITALIGGRPGMAARHRAGDRPSLCPLRDHAPAAGHRTRITHTATRASRRWAPSWLVLS